MQVEALPDNVPAMVDVMLSRLERDIGKRLVHGILGSPHACHVVLDTQTPAWSAHPCPGLLSVSVNGLLEDELLELLAPPGQV